MMSENCVRQTTPRTTKSAAVRAGGSTPTLIKQSVLKSFHSEMEKKKKYCDGMCLIRSAAVSKRRSPAHSAVHARRESNKRGQPFFWQFFDDSVARNTFILMARIYLVGSPAKITNSHGFSTWKEPWTSRNAVHQVCRRDYFHLLGNCSGWAGIQHRMSRPLHAFITSAFPFHSPPIHIWVSPFGGLSCALEQRTEVPKYRAGHAEIVARLGADALALSRGLHLRECRKRPA